MKVMEVSDIEFTLARHCSGGRKAVRFGTEAAFLFGDEGIVPIRQRGAKCKLAFLTLWGGLVIGDADDGHLIMRTDKVEVKEVGSYQVQTYLKALKRRGWAPCGAEELDELLEQHEEVGADIDAAFQDTYEELLEMGLNVHMDHIWAPSGAAVPVVRDNRMALATAVIFDTESPTRDVLMERRIREYPVDRFITKLGVVVS